MSVFPDPVCAWMKASESEERSSGMAAFWMAVGALRRSFVVRWAESAGERPRVVKVAEPSERGAFVGAWSTAGGAGGVAVVTVAVEL